MDHAWDGIGASLVGAAVTVIAVIVTLRFERASTRQHRIEDEGVRLMAKAAELRDHLMHGRPEYMIGSFSWKIELGTFVRAIASNEACAAAMIGAAMTALGEADAGSSDGTRMKLADPQKATTMVMNIENLLRRRAYTPEYFKMGKEQCDSAINLIRDGWVV